MATTSKDLLISLAMHFVTNVSARANTVCAEHNKKTILPEHVFEALHASKQNHFLTGAMDTATFTRLSFNKQRDLVLAKLNGSELQQRKLRNAQANETQMTPEELLAEQEAMFERARLNQAQSVPQKMQIVADDPSQTPFAYEPTEVERVRDAIYAVDFEQAQTGADEQMFEF